MVFWPVLASGTWRNSGPGPKTDKHNFPVLGEPLAKNNVTTLSVMVGLFCSGVQALSIRSQVKRYHLSLGCRMSLGGYHTGGAPVHSTVARAGSPYSTLPVWPLCPFSWGWAHSAWGVGVRGTWKPITCVMVFPSGSGSHLRHRCGAPLPVPPPRHRDASSGTNAPSRVSYLRYSVAE